MNTNSDSNTKRKNSLVRLNPVLTSVVVISVVMTCISLAAPYLFTRPGFIDFSHTGEIGDTINGLMVPFISLLAAFLTFIAFYVQFQANQFQREQIARESFENRFFRLLEIHRQNVNDLQYPLPSGKVAVGQRLIVHICNLSNSLIAFIDKHPEIKGQRSNRDIRVIVYLFICHRRELLTNSWFTDDAKFSSFIDRDLIEALELHLTKTPDSKKDRYTIPRNGYINSLSRYFRQLFQIVSYVNDSKIFTDQEKYGYMKVLRSSLTNREEELLYNNVLSPYGDGWVAKDYVVKYKVLKNIPFFYLEGYLPTTWFVEQFGIGKERHPEFFEHCEYQNGT